MEMLQTFILMSPSQSHAIAPIQITKRYRSNFTAQTLQLEDLVNNHSAVVPLGQDKLLTDMPSQPAPGRHAPSARHPVGLQRRLHHRRLRESLYPRHREQ